MYETPGTPEYLAFKWALDIITDPQRLKALTRAELQALLATPCPDSGIPLGRLRWPDLLALREQFRDQPERFGL